MKPSLDELVEFAESQIGKEGTERDAVCRAAIVSNLRWLRDHADFLHTVIAALRAFPEAEISERTTQ